MRPTLPQLSPQQLAAAADANFAVHISWAHTQTPGMHVEQHDGLLLADSGLTSDTFNFVALAQLTEANAPARIADALAYFRQVDRPFAWWVGPADQPATLGAHLLAAGLEQAETELAMAVDLALIAPPSLPQGFTIRRVTTAEELHAFARINAANWNPPDSEALRYYASTAAALLRPTAPQWFYVGYLDGEPVAASEVTFGGEVVGLYNISTLAAYRRRGFGLAMTAQPLVDARAAGYHIGVLQAAAGGVSLYQRLGFTTFGQITEYKPPAARYTALLLTAPQPVDVHYLREQLVAYNEAQLGYRDAQQLVIHLRNGRGEVVGGLAGWTFWGWLAIDTLWLHEELRGQGYGAQLLQLAETEARARGCQQALVDTMSFQAPAFYQRHGYEIFSLLENFPTGHRRYYLRKTLG